MAKYIFRLDDLAPNMEWQRYRRLVQLLDRCGVRPVVGVIPDNRDPELLRFPECPFDFWQHVRERQQKGWTIALHGYRHLFVTGDPGLLGTHSRSEFAGLPYEEQHAKLRRGRELLSWQGVHSETFMAPAHTFDASTLDALRDLGFTAITDGYGLYPYVRHGILHVPQQMATPRRMPLGVFTFCLHPNWMSDLDFDRVETFLKTHGEDIVDFSQGWELAKPAWTQRPVEKIAGVLARSARTLRGRLRAGGGARSRRV